MSSPREPTSKELPAVDARLVAPESRYEIDDGELVYVPPADEPHAVNHGALGALLRAHRAPDRSVAIDMLTRTSETSDLAPDASIYPTARDPRGDRQLEELAFELMATEKRGSAAGKARKLTERGVRRVFAIDVMRQRAFEWSAAFDDWTILATTALIEDAALAVPLPVEAIVDAAKADLATVRAYRVQRHPEFVAEREEGREEGMRAALRHVLRAKFGSLAAEHDARIAGLRAEELARLVERAMVVSTLDELFAPT